MDKTKITNVELGDLDITDYPDYADVYIESADYYGIPMNEAQLNEINEDCNFVYDCVMKSLT